MTQKAEDRIGLLIGSIIATPVILFAFWVLGAIIDRLTP